MAATCSTATLTAKVSEEDGLASEDIKQILSVSIVEKTCQLVHSPKAAREMSPATPKSHQTAKGVVQMTARMRMM